MPQHKELTEQTQEERPKQKQPDTKRYLLQIERQTKRSFKTPEAPRSAALEVQVSITTS